ncbi:hypothetical protein ABFA07_015854 [Porites harrisoni]
MKRVQNKTERRKLSSCMTHRLTKCAKLSSRLSPRTLCKTLHGSSVCTTTRKNGTIPVKSFGLLLNSSKPCALYRSKTCGGEEISKGRATSVELPCATTSCKRPPPISDRFSKLPDLSKTKPYS